MLLQAPGRIFVRRERTLADVVLEIGGERPAASHDGKRVAFWRAGPQRNTQELRIVDVIGGAERMLTALPGADVGGAIAWANDDTGLLYEVHSSSFVGGAGGGPRSSRLESFDLAVSQASGATDGDLVLTGGPVFVPLAWDKAGALATALVTGEGGMAGQYVTWDRTVQPAGQSAVKRVQFPWASVAFSVKPSHDAKLMLAIDVVANALRVWPARDIAGSTLMRPATGKLSGASWRPGTPRDIAWAVETNVEMFTYGTSALGTIYRGQHSPFIEGWRADGSAILVFDVFLGTFVIDLADLSQTKIWDADLAVVGGTIVR